MRKEVAHIKGKFKRQHRGGLRGIKNNDTRRKLKERVTTNEIQDRKM